MEITTRGVQVATLARPRNRRSTRKSSATTRASDAVVVFLNPDNQGVTEDQATVHAKQSQLNFAVTGPSIGTYQTGGTIMMNFMGSQPLRNFSGANIVQAYGEVKNDRWRYAFGRLAQSRRSHRHGTGPAAGFWTSV